MIINENQIISRINTGDRTYIENMNLFFLSQILNNYDSNLILIDQLYQSNSDAIESFSKSIHLFNELYLIKIKLIEFLFKDDEEYCKEWDKYFFK